MGFLMPWQFSRKFSRCDEVETSTGEVTQIGGTEKCERGAKNIGHSCCPLYWQVLELRTQGAGVFFQCRCFILSSHAAWDKKSWQASAFDLTTRKLLILEIWWHLQCQLLPGLARSLLNFLMTLYVIPQLDKLKHVNNRGEDARWPLFFNVTSVVF